MTFKLLRQRYKELKEEDALSDKAKEELEASFELYDESQQHLSEEFLQALTNLLDFAFSLSAEGQGDYFSERYQKRARDLWPSL